MNKSVLKITEKDLSDAVKSETDQPCGSFLTDAKNYIEEFQR